MIDLLWHFFHKKAVKETDFETDAEAVYLNDRGEERF